jgi:hypothetical protein
MYVIYVIYVIITSILKGNIICCMTYVKALLRKLNFVAVPSPVNSHCHTVILYIALLSVLFLLSVWQVEVLLLLDDRERGRYSLINFLYDILIETRMFNTNQLYKKNTVAFKFRSNIKLI